MISLTTKDVLACSPATVNYSMVLNPALGVDDLVSGSFRALPWLSGERGRIIRINSQERYDHAKVLGGGIANG